MIIPTLTWHKFDREKPDRYTGMAAIYIQVYTAGGNCPWYVGESLSVDKRMIKRGGHRDGFSKAMRTYFRPRFLQQMGEFNHLQFAKTWAAMKGFDRTLVYTPFDDKPNINPMMREESWNYWQHQMITLVAPFDVVRNDDGKKELRQIERRLQIDLEDYYNGLLPTKANWRVSHAASLFGQNNSPNPFEQVLHNFCGQALLPSEEFFNYLQVLEL